MNPPESMQKPVKYKRGNSNGEHRPAGDEWIPVLPGRSGFLVAPTYNLFGTISEDGLKTLDKILEKALKDDGKPKDEVRITSATKA